MIYITGASGFIGSHLIKRLKEYEHLHYSDIHTSKIKNIEKFYFLSSYGNMNYQTEDEKIIKANVTDLIDILNQVDWKTIKSFVFISSSSVKLHYQTMYSRTKRAAEEILLSFAEKYKAPICIIRPYSVTGVGEQANHLIPRLIRSCLFGEEIEFVPQPVHDFIDVEDVVEGILTLSNAGARGIFELGSGIARTNQDILKIVTETTNKKAMLIPGIARPYDTDDWVSRSYRARGFGWTPKIHLEESIRNMVDDTLKQTGTKMS